MSPPSETTPLVNAQQDVGSHPTTAKQVSGDRAPFGLTPKPSGDSQSPMTDPQSISPAKKKLFVVGMILASFLASLDLTGEHPKPMQIAHALSHTTMLMNLFL